MPISRASTGMLIGIDFDDTLVTYDEVLREAALARALIDTDFAGTKQDGIASVYCRTAPKRCSSNPQTIARASFTNGSVEPGIETDPAQSAKPRSA